jgi:quercetin dioxygenase-like cupin family protein
MSASVPPHLIRPPEFRWSPHPDFRRGVQFAMLHGDPGKLGKYVIRVHSEPEVRFSPHTHPEDRVYTVLDGLFGIGFGDRFEPESIQEMPPGSVIFVPALHSHFQFAPSSAGYTVQINGIGPTATNFTAPIPETRRETRGPAGIRTRV